ncbi:hypothetical protein HSHS1_07590 [Helicobacter suis HS1]|nr:hypothetical protein [Helicobacter suis]BDR27998.1 hypothetical protein HSHS1_07590 [Helicobacter suis HS1]
MHQAFLSGAYDWRMESMAKVWARGYVGKGIKEGNSDFLGTRGPAGGGVSKGLFKHLELGFWGIARAALKEFLGALSKG